MEGKNYFRMLRFSMKFLGKTRNNLIQKKQSICFSYQSYHSSSKLEIQAVVSRQVFRQFKRNQSKTDSKKKQDETPWPRSVQIAGYVLASLMVPFTISAMIIEIPSFRTFLAGGDEEQMYSDDRNRSLGNRCISFVREFWGEEECAPEQEKVENNSLYFQNFHHSYHDTKKSFENEGSPTTRITQREIGKMINSPHKVKITSFTGNDDLNSGGETSSTYSVISSLQGDFVDGKLNLGNGHNSALRGKLMHSFNGKKNEDEKDTYAPYVFLEFLDQNELNDGDNSPDGVVENGIFHTKDIEPTSGVTQIWSSWHAFPQEAEKMYTSNKNDFSIEEAQLEQKILLLRSDINDPNCLKDIDSMKSELKGLENSLRKIRWKRWF